MVLLVPLVLQVQLDHKVPPDSEPQVLQDHKVINTALAPTLI